MPGKREPVGKFLIIREEDCINCGVCVDICVFGVHFRDKEDIRKMAEPASFLCKNCFACVRNCPRNSLSLIINPEFQTLGGRNVPSDVVLSTLSQAETGKIPVFGAGYKGSFADEGFDAIWTDMSEIVRPTRDGIHGREYISTCIDLGRKLPDMTTLDFYPDGRLKSNIPPTREVPLPILFSYPEDKPGMRKLITAISIAGVFLGTFTRMDFGLFDEDIQPYINHLIFQYSKDVRKNEELLKNVSLMEFKNDKYVFRNVSAIKEVNPHMLTIIEIDGKKALKNPEYLCALVDNGAEIIHIKGDIKTGNIKRKEAVFIDLITKVHRTLVDRGIRDGTTILASGPILKAEHVIKTILLGADGVIIDLPLLIAMECLCCDECVGEDKCPSNLDDIDVRWGAQRVINLMASWHSQMLEVLGAMGLRDVRRLRGETGRAIFYKELEREIFEPIFKRS